MHLKTNILSKCKIERNLSIIKKSKKALSLIISIIMVFSLLAMSALAAPIITINTQPAATTNVTVGGSAALSVGASATEDATLTYQWYSCTDTNKADAHTVIDAVYSSIDVPTTTAGTFYYYVTVSADSAEPVDSNVATVAVTAEEEGVSITTITITDGTNEVTSGQVNTPYQITVSVRNDNNTYSITPTITLYEVGNPGDTQIDSQTLPMELSTNSTTTSAAITWTPSTTGSHTLRAAVTGDMNSEPITPVELTKNISITAADGSVPYDGTQIEAGPYSISTCDQLTTLSTKVNSGTKYTGTTFIFTNNITLPSGWSAIGSSATNYFGGTFDGGGHTISGININDTNATKQGGLFSYINGATINNLKISGSINAKNNVGGFAYTATNSSFYNCTNNVNVTTTAANAAGFVCVGNTVAITNSNNNGAVSGNAAAGFVSQGTNVVITSSTNNGGITSTGGGNAGFVGQIRGGTSDKNKIEACTNNAPVTGTTYLAGIVAQIMSADYSVTIEDCTNETTGTITSASNGVNTGGIAGYASGKLSGCVNKADIIGLNAASGIAGTFFGEITNCANRGEIKATTYSTSGYVAGIVGQISRTTTLSGCLNLNDVMGPFNVGGLIGKLNTSSNTTSITITDCYNRGNVSEYAETTATGMANISGLIGWMKITIPVNISNCYNTGTISSQNMTSVGGLVGFIQADGSGQLSIQNCYNSAPVSGKDSIGGLFGTLTSSETNPTATVSFKNIYSAANTVTGASSSTKVGIGIGELSKYTSSAPFTISNVFAEECGNLKAIGYDTDGAALDANLIGSKTAAQLSDASFLDQIGGGYAWFSQSIFGTGEDAQEFDEDAYNQYAEYYGDYNYPILLKLCGVTPDKVTHNVQVVGAQYMTVRFGDVRTYATTVSDNGTVSFTVTSDYPEDLEVDTVSVGSETLIPENGVYTVNGINADTIITVSHTGDAPTLPSEDTLYPVIFCVTDAATGNAVTDATITVTDQAGDGNGVYSISAATYVVSIRKDGYKTVNGTFDVTRDMSATATNTINVTLYPDIWPTHDLTLSAGNSGEVFNVRLYNGDVRIGSIVSGGYGAYTTSTFNLPDGDYTYTADGAGGDMGGGPLKADADKTVTLRFVNFSNRVLNQNNVGYTMSVTSSDGNTIYTPGSLNTLDGGSARGWFVLPASEYGEAYKYTFTPISASYWGSYGTTYLYISGTTRNYTGLNLSDSGYFLIVPKTTVSITAPENASLHLYHRVRFYEPLEELTAARTDNGNGTVTYTFEAPRGEKLHYELKLAGYVKKAATLTAGITEPITIALSDLTPVSEAATDITNNKYDSDILTNAPDSKYIELQSGEKFELYLHRSWQATDSITGNYYVDPDYHIEVVSGDSVQITDPYYAGASIEAVNGKSGISIVRITYDALDFADLSGNSYLYSKLYEMNTVVLAVNVNPSGNTSINTGIRTIEYETQYFARSINDVERDANDRYAEYTFTPTVTGSTLESVPIHAPIGSTDTWTDTWQTIEPNTDGSYTAKLAEGRSIVRFTAADGAEAYYVIKAAGLDITVGGDSVAVRLNDGQFEVASDVSDTLTVTFSGLQMPLPKLGAIYNPGYDYYSAGTTYAIYTLSGVDTDTPSSIQSANSQYDISTVNAVSLSFSSPDTYILSGGRLHTTFYGSSCGSYINIRKGGATGTQATYSNGANTTEDKSAGLYGSLPDITFAVTGIPDTGTAHTVTITAPNDLTSLTIRNHDTGYRKPVVSASNGTYTYSLYDNEGTTTYDYYAERAGYLTKVGFFTIAVTDTTKSVDITSDWTHVTQSGNVKVKVIGAESVPVNDATVAISLTVVDLDLAAQGYVACNYGGYTVLHALIDSLEANNAAFTCVNGILTPTITVTETVGATAGWICEVNGNTVADYAKTLINGVDEVVFYYNPATSANMFHAWFTDTAISATRDDHVSLTLLSTPVNNSETAPTPVPGATVHIDGTSVGTTDTSGTIALSNLKNLALGAHTVTAAKNDSDGNNTLTYARSILNLTAPSNSDQNKNTITVTFRLIGDTVHDPAYNGYINWIKTKAYTLPKDSTVEDLFKTALDDARITYDNTSDNYVAWIKAPAVLGEYRLAEFSNGNKSGWMYTVNGYHPDLGFCEYVLSDGDEVIWHYVNEYTLETSDGGGSGQYVNPWLRAADVNPNAGMVNESEKNAANSQIQEPKKPIRESNVVTPDTTVKNGVASVKMSLSELKDAIVATKENGGDIVIAPHITEEAKAVKVEVDKSALSTLTTQTDAGLTIQTPVGNVTLPSAALDSISSQATGSTVTINVENVDKTTLTADQQKAVGDDTVYDITIISGGKNISSFNGESITISLPHTLKDGQNSKNVKVWYLNDAGDLEEVACTYDKTTGMATFNTTHLSKYVVSYAETEVWNNPFTDVKIVDWFYSAVEFAGKNNLFYGTTPTTFGPNENMTRVMLVTVLYRLEGSPAVTGTNNFTDVKSGECYADAVIWANANCIVAGYGNGMFGTTDNVTREQMAVILHNYAKFKGYDVTKTVDLKVYTDADSISGYAQSAMIWANAEGLITGRTTTTLVPTGRSTRAEVATILMRFMENIVK